MSSGCLSSTAFRLYSNSINIQGSNRSSSSSSSYLLRVPPVSGSSWLSLSHTFNPLSERIVKSRTSSRRRGLRAVCYAAPLTLDNLRLVSTVSSVVLILARGTPVHKSFIVPLFAMQAPAGVIGWIQGRYGLWSAFLALLVRLFFYIPGELELPLLAFLLVIVAPYEAMRLRDTKEGAIISLLIALYLAFQHFSRTSWQKSFDQGSIVATLAVVCITIASLLLLI